MTQPMNRAPEKRPLSLAHLTAIDLPPPALIHAAAKAGFDAVGLRLLRVTPTSPGYPLMQDPAQLRATQDALSATGLRVHEIEFVKLEPDTDPAHLCAFLDTGAALGAREVICAPYDPDLTRLADRLGALADLAAARDLGVSLEFFPWTVVPSLEAALRVVEQAGPTAGILVDSLHFNRSTSRRGTLTALPAQRLRFAHLCDARVAPPYTTDSLLHTAREDRLPPGQGDIDLVDFLRALPADLPLGLEVPRPAPADPADSIAEIMRATQDLLRKTDGAHHIADPTAEGH
ncbi:sugar phosphate isomerase/epimerase [Antarctobacter sp.]|uniref:sugar phosphate isomerase/epimerase family protein n=1 Tax=Antarctobacter sp. TaxID=1872577 RepID=UPI002B271B74|nr:sugar phosphate isomerase/epimerase [Antarctobacter sp.]